MSGLAEVFRRQAQHFEELGSPLYARLAERLADDPEAALAVVGDDRRWDLPLRLFGAVHYLVLTGAAPNALSGRFEDFADALVEEADAIRARLRIDSVQTNEVQRCTFLLPAFLAAASETGLPLELLELGPSAGLNLLADRYRYRYADGEWGRPDARPVLAPREDGRSLPASLLDRELVVRRRRGIDLAPIDATTDEGYLLLRSFVWPGLDDRVARLDAAVATLRELTDPPELIAGDYARLLPDLLRTRPDDALTVVFDTFSTVYLPLDVEKRLKGSLEEAGNDGRPLAWLGIRRWDASVRKAQFELELRVWPDPPRLAAYVDPHGNSLDWVLC